MNVLAGLLIAIAGSVLTTTAYVAIVWRLDRYEKEPARLLAIAFFWGMLPSVIISLVFELLFDSALGGAAGGSLLSDAGAAPIIEESAKGLALLLFLAFAYREFDDVLDGIVYGAMIGFGFAFTENILYSVSGVAETGIATGVAILFLRSVIFGVNHAFFTGVTGAGAGAARLVRSRSVRLVLLIAGWLLAIAFHSVHNVGTTLAADTNLVSLGISFLFDWGGVALLLVLIALVWRKERQWIAEELYDEVPGGLLTIEQYTSISTTTGRQRMLARALRQDGWAAYRRLGRTYALLTELAFKKRQLRLLGDEPGTHDDILSLRQAILRDHGGSASL